MSLLVKARREGRDIVDVTPQSAGWRYVGFSAHRLAAGEAMPIDRPEDELCIVVLARWRDGCAARLPLARTSASGAACSTTARRMRSTCRTAPRVGSRAHGGRSRARAARRAAATRGAAHRAVADEAHRARQRAERALRLRHPAADRARGPPARRRGAHAERALVELSAAQARHRRPAAGKLARGDVLPPAEPPQGFAFQRVYTDDRSLDESLAVEDHDVVMVPRGYHPVVVPYGYESYYLNVMAGPRANGISGTTRRTNGCCARDESPRR